MSGMKLSQRLKEVIVEKFFMKKVMVKLAKLYCLDKSFLSILSR